jgi:flagellar biosynthesis protein FlhG
MSRIITIASGLAGTGKSHLAINLAAEFVRKGRLVGLYHDDRGHASIDRLLQLSRTSVPRRAPDNDDVLCHGYQGLDVISSRYPLASWNTLEAAQLSGLVAAHAAWKGYDDFLIDTSGMSPRGVVACCLQSRPVILVVTPQAQSQAEAFALLKVLRLNEFHAPVLLVINRVTAMSDVSGIHERLAGMAERHLELELPLLGTVAEDEHVMAAQRLHQAYSSVFPEASASADVVRLADALAQVTLPGVAEESGLEGFWKALVQVMHTPIHLAGHVDLADFDHLETPPAAVDQSPEMPVRPESTVLRYEGPMVRLDRVMESFSSVMHVMADDLLAFYDRLLDMEDMPEPSGNDVAALERKLATILRVLKDAINQQRQICIQIEENTVGGEDADWLRPGHYIKYALQVPAEEDAMARLTSEMEQVPGVQHNRGDDGECICEALSAQRDTCLSVIHTPQGDIRIHYWHALEQGAGLSPGLPAGHPLDHHPTHKRLH